MEKPASPAFLANLEHKIQSPVVGNWADEVDDEEAGPQGDYVDPRFAAVSAAPPRRQQQRPNDEDGFTVVNKRRQRKAPGAARGNSNPRSAPMASSAAPRTYVPPPQRLSAERAHPTVVIDPRPPPPPAPAALNADSKQVYNIIRENQAAGGCTARKIHAILADRQVLRDDGQPFDFLYVGDILYDELKARQLVFKVGERGGKWRILV